MPMSGLLDECRAALVTTSSAGLRSLLRELADHEIVAVKGLIVHLLAPAQELLSAIQAAFPGA